MTEEEAKTKWCPFVRQFTYPRANAVAANRASDGAILAKTQCIASACMAWRATDNERSLQAAHVAFPKAGHYLPAGYCGLAGVPQ